MKLATQPLLARTSHQALRSPVDRVPQTSEIHCFVALGTVPGNLTPIPQYARLPAGRRVTARLPHPPTVAVTWALAAPTLTTTISQLPRKVVFRAPDDSSCAVHYWGRGGGRHDCGMRRRAIERGVQVNEYTLGGPQGPLACPPDRTRKSIATYYFTNGRPADDETTAHPVAFVRRAGHKEPLAVQVKSLLRSLTPPLFLETYRKLRNTIRWMLGTLAHFRDEDRIAFEKMPELT